ncbi:MAG: alanyl-tRNA editing protein [Methanomassiliicoccales archaeon]
MTLTRLLYMDNIEGNYIKRFRAKVLEQTDDGDVILDQTAFYPEGGGQPSDKGLLYFDTLSVPVSRVHMDGEVVHELEGWLPDNVVTVKATLDWERRYVHMRMHTAQHILSGVAFDRLGAGTEGLQIQGDRSSVDLSVGPEKVDLEDLQRGANEVVSRALPIGLTSEDPGELRERIEGGRVDFARLPKVKRLRVVSIQGFDEIPCAGTHVRNTQEVGSISLVGKEGHGDGTRILFELD